MCHECMQPIMDTQQMRQCEYKCQRTYHRSCTMGHLAANNIKYNCNLSCMCAAKPCKRADKEVSGKNQFDWCFSCRRAFHSSTADVCKIAAICPQCNLEAWERGLDEESSPQAEAEHTQQGQKTQPVDKCCCLICTFRALYALKHLFCHISADVSECLCCNTHAITALTITMQFIAILIMVTHKQWCERGNTVTFQCHTLAL